jgi:hypothetical protein
MSRIRIFAILLIGLLVGIGSFLLLSGYWVNNYREQVLEPELHQHIKAVSSAIDLYAYHKTELISRHILESPKLLSSFDESDLLKRRDRVHDELYVLKGQKLKTASIVAAVDMKGKGFVRSGDVNWSDDWKDLRPVQIALGGSSAHGITMYEKRQQIFIAVPVFKQITEQPKAADADPPSDTDTLKSTVPPAAHKQRCPANQEWYCWRKCLRRDPKTKRCIDFEKKERCYCRAVSKKPASLLKKSGRSKTKKATKTAEPKTTDAQTAEVKTPTNSELTPKHTRQLGVIVFGFLLDDRMAQNIKQKVSLDISFASTNGELIGSTLSGRFREQFEQLFRSTHQKTEPKIALVATGQNGTDTQPAKDKTWYVKLDGESFVVLSSPISSLTNLEMILLRPLSTVNELFRNYLILSVGIGCLAFLLSILLILSSINRFRRDLETIEDGILDTYNSGNLQITFNQEASWILGALATSLNKLYAQLRGEKDEEDDDLKRSGEWNLEGLKMGMKLQTSEEPNASVQNELPEQTAGTTTGPTPQTTTPLQSTPISETDSKEDNEINWIEHFLQNPDLHYEEIFMRYMAGKEELGEDVSRMNKERFIDKLRKNAADCMVKYDNCRGVMFDVTIKDGKVILKPQLIPKE